MTDVSKQKHKLLSNYSTNILRYLLQIQLTVNTNEKRKAAPVEITYRLPAALGAILQPEK